MADSNQNAHGRGTMAPYVPFQTIKTFLETLKPHRLPGRIDRSLLRNFSGAIQGQLITALRFLGLIDTKGVPTPVLENLHQIYGTEQWPGALAELLRTNYGPLFEIGLDTASPAQFYERYRATFPGAEDVIRKSATFFLNAAREAKIEISEHITRNKKPRSAGAVARRRAARAGPAREPSTPAAESNSTFKAAATDTPRAPNAYELLAVFDPSDMNPQEQAAVWTLIQYLKRKEVGVPVPKQRRDLSAKTRPAAAAGSSEGGADGTALAEAAPSDTASG